MKLIYDNTSYIVYKLTYVQMYLLKFIITKIYNYSIVIIIVKFVKNVDLNCLKCVSLGR